jgi:hypothetical protein
MLSSKISQYSFDISQLLCTSDQQQAHPSMDKTAHFLSIHPPIENVLEYDGHQKHAEVRENASHYQHPLVTVIDKDEEAHTTQG